MKVPPKRKGNLGDEVVVGVAGFASMKVPPKRKGNAILFVTTTIQRILPQ